MTDIAVAPHTPAAAEPAPDRQRDTDGSGIDPDDTTLVPAALLAMVSAVQDTHRVMQVNGCYPPIMAVGSVEDAVANLVRVCHHLLPYVGDYSRQGETAVGRAEALLEQARALLSSARHHLAIDEVSSPDPGVSVGTVAPTV